MNEKRWMKAFGDNLKILLQEYRVSQRDLSEMSGLTETTISRYIHGKSMPTVQSIVAISEALDCSYDVLLDIGH